jgi:AcrR family transcriptional regulator
LTYTVAHSILLTYHTVWYVTKACFFGMARMTKQDWLEAGLVVLGAGGAAALTIDRLASRLGVTKGSFYHHFENYQEYKEHLLAFWEQGSALNVIEFPQVAETPSALVGRLLASLDELSPYPEIAIRAWALQDEVVRAYVERIDVSRIAQAQRWFRAVAADDEQALLMARLLHITLVGSYTVLPPILGEPLKDMVWELMWLYGIDREEA